MRNRTDWGALTVFCEIMKRTLPTCKWIHEYFIYSDNMDRTSFAGVNVESGSYGEIKQPSQNNISHSLICWLTCRDPREMIRLHFTTVHTEMTSIQTNLCWIYSRVKNRNFWFGKYSLTIWIDIKGLFFFSSWAHSCLSLASQTDSPAFICVIDFKQTSQ